MALNSAFIYLGIAILAEVIGTLLLKESQEFSKLWPSIFSISCYFFAFYLLSLTLTNIPVAIAYALWAGIGIIMITLLSWIIFNQQLDIAALVGIFLIISGVVVINLFSDTLTLK